MTNEEYIANPKTKGSGILAAIPQTGRCPNNCEDCFFQSGRSYLEPLDEHLPNLPPVYLTKNRVVRINDGNDSNVKRKTVMMEASRYDMKFFNTAIARDLEGFVEPVVLTLNPGKMTDTMYQLVDPIPKNLMFVRARTNTWNLENLVKPAVEYYTSQKVPVVLTFMAYFDEKSIPEKHKANYMLRKRTTNSYNAITTDAWEKVMQQFKYNIYVYSCGKIEGEKGKTSCERCGNCLREYFATEERIRDDFK